MLSRRELLLLRAMYLHGTVTAASASIHISQPAASALLRDLETRLGFALFSRENRRLCLTSQGRALLPEVLHALSGMEAVDRLASDIRKGAADRLTIGAVAVVSSMLLPSALALVRKSFPKVAIAVRAGTALEIVDMAVDHRIDLGIIIVRTDTVSERVCRDRLRPLSLYAVVHKHHPLAQSERAITLASVAECGLIALSPALPAGLATLRAMETAGVEYRPFLEVSQSIAACELAAQCLGVAVVEALGAQYAQREGLVVKHLLTDEDAELALVFPRDKPLEGAGLELRTALKASTGEVFPSQRGK